MRRSGSALALGSQLVESRQTTAVRDAKWCALCDHS
jgi:hypothetical protein